MAFKLNKAEVEQRADLIARLSDASAKIAAAVDDYNARLQELRAPIEETAAAYNEIAAEAREFAEGIASQADEDMSNKSEKWQESERGQAAEEFKNEWENISFDDIEPEYPDEMTFDEPDHAGTLEQAPEELAA